VNAYAETKGTVPQRIGASLVAAEAAIWKTITSPFRAFWRLAFRKLTIAWSYLGIAGSVAASQLDWLGQIVGDPEIKQQIADALKDHPEYLGYVTGAIFAITILARARSMIWRPKE
jgi:hypothetical protein